jgi:hypothetical protein
MVIFVVVQTTNLTFVGKKKKKKKKKKIICIYIYIINRYSIA